MDELDKIVRQRLLADHQAVNAWRVTKDSGIAGKAVTELPGLVVGSPSAPARRVAVTMTLTEHTIELARAAEIDVVIAHHPVADAASAGGVELAHYVNLYGISVIECHEALHGLHPGIAWLHGHVPLTVETAFGGNPGMVVLLGEPVDGVETAGDVLDRLDELSGRSQETLVNHAERAARQMDELWDSCVSPTPRMISGERTDRLGDLVVHVFPHTGFSALELRKVLAQHPDVGAVIVSISTVTDTDPLVLECSEAGIPLIGGSSHSYEIIENGLPLALALQEALPMSDVVLLRERVTMLPLDSMDPRTLAYGRSMAAHLIEGRSS